jgi:uncharacterized membrane protein (DUF4010 family)
MGLSLDLFIQLAYALGIGTLIGLERSMDVYISRAPSAEDRDAGAAEESPRLTKESIEPVQDAPAPEEASASEQRETDRRAAVVDVQHLGVRTYAVFSLVGFGAALVSDQVPGVALVAMAGVVLLILAMYHHTISMGTGITTEVAAVGTAVLGFLCHQHPHVAGVLALIMTVLLASKRFTHGTIQKMRRVELTDTLKFLVVLLIVLPMLPNRALDPWGALNPYKVGLLVVLISGISFVGYFLTRILGAQRGLGLTGILGGLTSSTAVTAAMAAEAKQQPGLRPICAFSTLAANATSFVRVLVVVFVLDRALGMRLAWSVGGMAVTAIAVSVVLWFMASGAARDGQGPGVKLKNPFSVGPALKFAVFFVGILVVAKLAKVYLGSKGLYLAAAVSGLADVDAITMSIAEQTRAVTLDGKTGAIGITIAVVSNAVVKTGMAISTGGWPFGRIVALGLGLATAVGLGLAVAV